MGSYFFGGSMKSLKEFKPLLKLIREDRKKLIFASILVFAASLSGIFSGYLNGAAIESITALKVKESLMYLGAYLPLN